jgi:hypothetical protein
MKKPDLSSTLPGCGYQPKQSDLILTGAAESVWHSTGIEFDSEAQVLATAGMVRLDWQRSVLAPQVLPCIRDGILKELPTSQRLVSFSQISFPQLAPYVRAYRVSLNLTTTTATVPLFIDIVLVGRGRTEITLTTTAAGGANTAVSDAEVRVATLLLGRARA